MITNVALVVLDTARALDTPVGPDPEAPDPETMPTLSELATAGTAYGRLGVRSDRGVQRASRIENYECDIGCHGG